MKNLLYWLAGTDSKLIAQCPEDQLKHLTTGTSILSLFVLASFSSGYAIFLATHSIFLASAFGIVWGLTILSIDRLIISTIRAIDRLRIAVVIPLIPTLSFAVIITLVISIPIELKLFAEPINQAMAGGHYSTDNFLSRIEVLQTLKSQSATLYWASWLVNALFLVIVASPILIHSLSPKGKYDILVEQRWKAHLQQFVDEQRLRQSQTVDDQPESGALIIFEKSTDGVNTGAYRELSLPTFGSGFASMIDWFGDLAPTIEEYRGGKKRTLEEARDAALARDWAVIGQDLQKVLDKYGKESPQPNV